MDMEQFNQWVREGIEEGTLLDSDHAMTEKDGEIVIRTGMYEWSDGSVHNTPDPDYDSD